MNKTLRFHSLVIFASLLFIAFSANTFAQSITKTEKISIISAEKINETSVAIHFSNQQKMLLDFYGDNIFRMFQDNSGSKMREPEATPAAKILVDDAKRKVSKLNLESTTEFIKITTANTSLQFKKEDGTFKIINLKTNQLLTETSSPIAFDKNSVRINLTENKEEYFYGGGVQNGRFSHKGKIIAIENQNSWTDGGVASPTPFYWSTNGYGFMWYTFKKGRYDFGSSENGRVQLSHETPYLDVFFMVNETPAALLNDFYQLTGKPVLLPKFGFYQGHLNAYNRDYWKKDSTGILFEDGFRYRESQKDNGGIKESLNGEKNNYQFSARAVIDRYKAHDMPLGWILPNDGYGAGYGQTGTLDSNILNLKSFGDYARKNGVQIGLWTQSDLHPKKGISALLQRDIINEVGVAGVRVLKTDVAWVGPGYSFGLNGVADVATIMPKHGKNARPFIISLDGWAGTQRYAGIWSGDQTGGVWEYIRFHIPTYIGSGLSGQPNISSDMDGIFGGKNFAVNVRDFQWKTFSPMQLNMDGWGSNEKYPHALGEPATSINRLYLKLKSQLMPYTYSIAKEAVDGLPMIRAIFLHEKNNYTLSKATQYQYLYGPYFLVAPIYKNTKADAQGNDIRNGIYLPKGLWIDYFNSKQYTGGRILNNVDASIWKFPVFVKAGAIIPLTNANNNVSEINKKARIYEIYPFGKSAFTEYDDDGFTEAYKSGKGAYTKIESQQAGNKVVVTVQPTTGTFDGFEKFKTTEFRINATAKPTEVQLKAGSKNIPLKEVLSEEVYKKSENVFYYNHAPEWNQFSTKGSIAEKESMKKNPQVFIKTKAFDVTKNKLTLTISGFKYVPEDELLRSTGKIASPLNAMVKDSNAKAYTLTPTWNRLQNADYYEIEFDGMNYSTIKDTFLVFEDLKPETDYSFKIRSVNKSGASAWSSFNAKTAANPLQFAIKGITASINVPDQGGSEISHLFNFDENDMWHTKWSEKATPFDIVMDLRSLNHLDKLQYLPRDRGNGILMKGKIFYSSDKKTWTEAGAFDWAANGETKTFNFTSQPVVRYIKISVTNSVGNFGSGRELYVFKVPGTESYIPGDINNDGKVDENDYTSYINYTGLRKGDGDFDGYISGGDVNKNNIIDAFDISNVTTRLDGGVKNSDEIVSGKLEILASERNYNAGETIEVAVKGIDLKGVNALSFAIPYNAEDFEFTGIKKANVKEMENITNDRLHSNGEKVLYPTFVNLGDKPSLNGNDTLFIITFKAKRSKAFKLKYNNGILVDKQLNTITF